MSHVTSSTHQSTKNIPLSSPNPLSLHGMHSDSQRQQLQAVRNNATPRHEFWMKHFLGPQRRSLFAFLHAISSSRGIFERDFLTFFCLGWMGLDQKGIKALKLEICTLLDTVTIHVRFPPLEYDHACVALSHMFLVQCYAWRRTCHRQAMIVIFPISIE